MPSAAPVIARNFRAKWPGPGLRSYVVGHHQARAVARGAHVVAIQWNGLGLLIDHSTLRHQSMRAGPESVPTHTCPFKKTLRYSTTMRQKLLHAPPQPAPVCL